MKILIMRNDISHAVDFSTALFHLLGYATCVRPCKIETVCV